MKAVMGIDPGVRGGVAILTQDGTVAALHAFRPTDTHGEIVDALVDLFEELHAFYGSSVCLIEKVGYIKGDSGKGAFTFGCITGLIHGALLASGAEVCTVAPMIWQASLGCLSHGDKNVTKRRAQELFPGQKITHGVADALLIAEYARRLLAFSGGSIPTLLGKTPSDPI